MAETWEVEVGGQVYEVEAESPQKAVGMARLLDARERSVAQATAGPRAEAEALAQSGAPADRFRQQLATAGSFGHTPQPEEMPEGAAAKLGMAATIASLPMGVQAAAAPIAALKSLGMGALGAWGGGKIGGEVGEMVGEPGIGKAIGATVGGIAAPMAGPGMVRDLALGGKAGILKTLLGQAPETAEMTAARVAAGAKRAEIELAKLAEKKATREAMTAARARTAQIAEERNALMKLRYEERIAKEAAKAAPKAGPRAVPAAAPRTEGATALKPEPEFIPEDAVSLVAEPLPFKPRPSKGTTTIATNLGGRAKPGPPPTPPDKLEEVLQASLEAGAMHPRAATAGMTEAVAARRKAIGADKVAKELGMTPEQVRSDAGEILDEALGDRSKVIPEEPWAGIVKKMLSMPPSERPAYVARARGQKNIALIEGLRRSLEVQGLSLFGLLSLSALDEEK